MAYTTKELQMDEIRAWLRENAKQVKGFEVDMIFNKGAIKCFEREDLGPKGYKVIEVKFKSFEDLKKHYGSIKSKSSVKEPSEGREELSSDAPSGGRIKKVLGRIKSFGRDKR